MKLAVIPGGSGKTNVAKPPAGIGPSANARSSLVSFSISTPGSGCTMALRPRYSVTSSPASPKTLKRTCVPTSGVPKRSL